MFLINLPYVSKVISPLLKISGQKSWRTFCRDHPLSLFHRFLNAKFFNRSWFTWTLFEKHIMYYSFLHIIFQQQRFHYFSNKSLWFSRRDHGRQHCLSYKISLYFQLQKIRGGTKLCRPSHLITYVCSPTNFHQVHLVIIDNNLFQSQSSFWDQTQILIWHDVTWLKYLQSPLFFTKTDKLNLYKIINL